MSDITLCCITCNTAIQEEIQHFIVPNIVSLLLIGVIVLSIIFGGTFIYRRQKPDSKLVRTLPILRGAVLLGVGIGGFIDGILFHQILQWHEMISVQLPPVTLAAKSVNMFWDGIFHSVMLAA